MELGLGGGGGGGVCVGVATAGAGPLGEGWTFLTNPSTAPPGLGTRRAVCAYCWGHRGARRTG